MLENLIAFVDEVNDRPVGNPKRRFDEYSSKFSLSYETKVINPIGKRQTTEGDAREPSDTPTRAPLTITC
jgi:hypothetical protein